MSGLARFDGADFVLTDEFERMGKKMAFKEVFSNITTVSLRRRSTKVKAGGELKKIMTVKATKRRGRRCPLRGEPQ